MAKYMLISEPNPASSRFGTDLLAGILKGKLDTHLSVRTTNDGTIRTQIPLLAIDTPVIPKNSTAKRLFVEKSDDDVARYVTTFEKVERDNFFLTCVQGNDLDGTISEIRKICRDVQGFIFSTTEHTALTITDPGYASLEYVVAYGTLKETQTDDYNPMDQIGVSFKRDVVMMAPAEVSEKVLAENLDQIEE